MEPLDAKDALDNVTRTLTENKSLTRVVAVLTSFFALCAAVGGLMAGRCTTRGILAKNDAIYHQGLATDDWAFFQSRNIRSEIIGAKNSAKSSTVRDRFKKEADALFTKAKANENERDRQNVKSSVYMDVSKTFASSLAFLQVTIVLIPLTLIAETFLFFAFGNVMGVIGLAYLGMAYFEYFKILGSL